MPMYPPAEVRDHLNTGKKNLLLLGAFPYIFKICSVLSSYNICILFQLD